ncbi:trypsin-like cysteine/serine peptidase domain-containing protein [Annulohypoxylon moriforme]|nr:trypsin-like cysteine/serine peptidase domain-containing protein [Annulohypoxylon moriforme]
MAVPIDQFEHDKGQARITVQILAQNDLSHKKVNNVEDVKTLIRCLEILKDNNESTPLVSIIAHSSRYDSMHLIGYLLVRLLRFQEVLKIRLEHVDNAPDKNYAERNRLECSAARRIDGSCTSCEGLALIRNLMLIDGCEPQALIFKLLLRRSRPEAILRRNPRRVSPATTVQDGGIYSGIVRVVAEFKDHIGQRRRSSGSGTIIDNRHVVTVGHNVWNPEDGLAVSITIVRDDRADQKNYHVDSGVVHFQWVKVSSVPHDFTILHVSEPFHDQIQHMKYETTPTSGGVVNVGIHGFPYDMPSNDQGHHLAHLCYSQSQVEYVPNDYSMVLHDGDTESGNSGGPVVDTSSNTVIAVHRGSCGDSNEAIAINHHGNDIEMFMKVLASMTDTSSAKDPRIVQGREFPYNESTVAGVRWE